MKTTTQEALDFWLRQFVVTANALRKAVGSEAKRAASNKKAEAETALIKAYNNHYPER